MLIIKSLESVASIPDTAIRQMVQQRIDAIASDEPYDSDLHGYFVVLTEGDTLATINQPVGFDILCNRWSGHRFDHADYRPAFEVLEEYPTCFDFLFTIEDGGYGIELIIKKSIAIPELLAMCKRYAVPGTF
jgi:hypothetical protein